MCLLHSSVADREDAGHHRDVVRSLLAPSAHVPHRAQSCRHQGLRQPQPGLLLLPLDRHVQQLR